MIESFSDAVNMWNCFHDGSIVKVTQTDSQTYEVEIEIAYLMEEILGKEEGAFALVLFGCEKFVYVPIESPAVTKIEEISQIDFGILEAQEREDNLWVFGSNNGILKLKYQSSKLYLEGKEITLMQLNDAQKSYWDQFRS